MLFLRALLRLYPASFRAEYEDQLVEILRLRRREVSGTFGLLAFWLDTVVDVVINAARVHGDILRQDLRYAATSLGKSPGFTATVVLVSALGVGLTTAVFSVIDRALIRALPFAHPEELVRLWERQPEYSQMELSPPNFRDWQRLSTSFDAMAAYTGFPVNMVGRGEPQRLEGALVTAELFPLLGVEPLLGRTFAAEDDREGAPGVLVLSHGLWQAGFGSSMDVLGTRVRLDDEPFTVIGVMPPGFRFPTREAQLWMPFRLEGRPSSDDRDNNYLNVIARLRDSVTFEQARAEMEQIAAALERAYPDANAKTGATMLRLREVVTSQSRLLLSALFGASLCLLLIACTNLASLMLVRFLARRKELTIRTAMGAGRERLYRQLITESVLLAGMGGLVGIGIAAATMFWLARLLPVTLPLADGAAIDVRVLSFAMVLTAVTGLGFGVLPAVTSCRAPDMRDLRDGTRAGRAGHERFRSTLVVAQITAAVVLLVSAGLLVRALLRVQDVDPGFRADGVLTVQTPLSPERYAGTERRASFYRQVLADVRALPGVTAASYISFLPMTMRGGIWPVSVDGRPPSPETASRASLRFVAPGFFDTLGIPLLRGRDLSEADHEATAAVAVVSASFASRYWPGENPIDRQFHFAFRDRRVVGVVGDIRVRGLERPSEPQVYLPHRQVPDGGLVFYAPKELVIRTSSDASAVALAPAVRRIIRGADAEVPVAAVRTLGDVVEAETGARVDQLTVLGVFAALALLLGGFGLHGLLSFAVSQRTPEIGLRIALGAAPRAMLGMILRRGVSLAAAGVATGAVLALAAGQAMEGLLAGVAPTDPVTLAVASTLAFVMALSGSLLPALRATRIDPLIAIKGE